MALFYIYSQYHPTAEHEYFSGPIHIAIFTFLYNVTPLPYISTSISRSSDPMTSSSINGL